jgi:hypothetical protein
LGKGSNHQTQERYTGFASGYDRDGFAGQMQLELGLVGLDELSIRIERSGQSRALPWGSAADPDGLAGGLSRRVRGCGSRCREPR